MHESKPQTRTTVQLLELAGERQLAGDFPEARRLCHSALALEPANAAAFFRLGLLELQEDRLDSALELIERSIANSPGATRHYFALGQVLGGLGRFKDAASAYRRVVESEPHLADVHHALGRALQAQGDLPAAEASYRAAVQSRPEFAEALNDLGNCQRLRGQLSLAEASYRRALGSRFGFASALGNLGGLLREMGRPAEAVNPLREAARLEPEVPSHLLNLGGALCELRRFAEAVAVLEEAVKLDDSIPEASYSLGNALLRLGRAREAAMQYRKAVSLRGDYAEAYNNLGNACREFGDFPAAIQAFAAAAKIDPGYTAAFNNLGVVYRSLGRMEEAERMHRHALAGNPGAPITINNLGNALKDSGELSEAIHCFRQAVSLDPTHAVAHSNLAYSLAFQATDGQTILEECLRWDARHGQPLRASIPSHDNDRTPERRLRVGYVSGDFRNHCQSLFTLPLFSHHDHKALEIFCYSSVERPNDYTRHIQRQADAWRSVRLLNDGELCDVIRSDRIDILVDLAMHMADGRPQLFARKPAPVQVAWLAYPGTTGISAMDYVLSDPRLASPSSDRDYSERVIRLPDTFWCYDPLTREPSVNELPAMTANRVSLACLNAPCKITDQTIRIWGGVMRSIENSRLLMMAPPGGHRRRLWDGLADQGIAPERVSIQTFLPRSDYLRSYLGIDLVLDTFPYNGHTTSLDSFWMGVPVVSRVGQTAVSRAGLSQLFNLGLSELAAETDEGFVEIATALATDLPRLAALRRQLRSRMERSPLMDGRRFAKNIENAYREIWREWCGS